MMYGMMMQRAAADDLHGLIAAAGAGGGGGGFRSAAAERDGGEGEEEEEDIMEEMEETAMGEVKARIASHPRYPTLLRAYIDCQKVLLITSLLFYSAQFHPSNNNEMIKKDLNT